MKRLEDLLNDIKKKKSFRTYNKFLSWNETACRYELWEACWGCETYYYTIEELTYIYAEYWKWQAQAQYEGQSYLQQVGMYTSVKDWRFFFFSGDSFGDYCDLWYVLDLPVESKETPITEQEERLQELFIPDLGIFVPALVQEEPILQDCPYCLQQHESSLIEKCPSKPQKHYCQWRWEAEPSWLKCGREAELFCEIGTCFPGTWYCQFHYKMKHVEFECPRLDEGPCFCPTHDYASCSVDRVNEFDDEVCDFEDNFTFLEINYNPYSDRDDGEFDDEPELGQDGKWHFYDEYEPVNWESNIHEIDY